MLAAATMAAVLVSALALPAWARAAGTLIVKGSDESVASTSTPQTDDELTFATTAGTAYRFEARIVYSSPAGAGTPDLKYQLGEDATVRGVYSILGISTADANTTGSSVTTAQNNLAGTATTDRVLILEGSHVGNGSPLEFRWSQNAAGSNPTVVRAGSTLFYSTVGDPDYAAGGGGGTGWDDITDKPTFDLSWLADADTTGAIDGAVLKYDEAASEWQVATDDAGGDGSSGPVTLSAGDRERLDLAWWGVWALVGLALLALIAPAMYRLLDVRHGMGGRFERG